MKSLQELETLAKKHGWKARKLTYADVLKMSPDEMNFHEHANREELERASNEPITMEQGKALSAKLRAKTSWSDKGSIYDSERAVREIQRFVRHYPQFDSANLDNREAILSLLKENVLEVTLPNLVRAFEQLTLQGGLTLLPEQIGLLEATITGHQLRNYDHLHKILEPHPIKSQEELKREKVLRQSSAEYLQEHPELQQDGIPPLVLNGINRMIGTFKENHPQYVQTEENRLAIVSFIQENKLPFNYSSVCAAYEALAIEGKLELSDPITYHGQICSQTDFPARQKVLAPADPRPVVIAEPAAPKRISPREIRNMDADSYEDLLRQYPELKNAIDEGAL